jgi:hypothetical protein
VNKMAEEELQRILPWRTLWRGILILSRKYSGRHHYVSFFVFVEPGEFCDGQRTDL